MVTAAKAAFNLHVPNEPFLVAAGDSPSHIILTIKPLFTWSAILLARMPLSCLNEVDPIPPKQMPILKRGLLS